MANEFESIAIEVTKAVASAAIGYLLGQKKEGKDRNSARVKECEQKAINLIRSTICEAVRFHSRNMPIEERIGAATMLKANLKMLSTDANHLAIAAGKNSNFYLEEYERFHIAITEEPFVTQPVSTSNINKERLDDISSAGEALVTVLYHIQASLR